jgi:hypothetical protein
LPTTALLLWRLRRLLHLLRLHLLHHGSAAAGDLPHPNLKREIAVFGEIGRGRACAESEPLRHGETVLAAFLHLTHRFGKAGENLVHGEWLRAAILLAAIENAAVIGS